MGGSECALARCQRSLQHRLGLGVFDLVCEGRSQIVRSRQRARMLGPEHALLQPKHLVLDPLSIGVSALALERLGQIARVFGCSAPYARMYTLLCTLLMQRVQQQLRLRAFALVEE